MIGQTSRILWLRWLAVVLLSLIWATTGSAAALEERGDFGHSSLVAKTPLTGPLRGSRFAAGTLVSTPDGKKPIEEIKEGDSVLAYDFTSAQIVEKAVTKLNWGETRCWIHVGVDTGDEIKATRFHPFWVENRNAWIEALDSEPGMILRLKSGELALVRGVRAEILEVPEPTFNFEVADVHNYFVASGVLVHNGGPTPQKPWSDTAAWMNETGEAAYHADRHVESPPEGLGPQVACSAGLALLVEWTKDATFLEPPGCIAASYTTLFEDLALRIQNLGDNRIVCG